MSESWECPKCQTLNAFGDQCYSCGEARPGTPDLQVPPATPDGFALIPPPIPDWQPTASIEPPPADIDVDTEPHPCWCQLVKGDHDIRDHPASAATDSDQWTEAQADEHLDQLEAELARISHDWADPLVERSYAAGDEGEQDYEDEMVIFEGHGYNKWVERPHHAINARYTLGDEAP